MKALTRKPHIRFRNGRWHAVLCVRLRDPPIDPTGLRLLKRAEYFVTTLNLRREVRGYSAFERKLELTRQDPSP